MRELLRIVYAAGARGARRGVCAGAACTVTSLILSACSLPVSVPGMSLDDTTTGSIRPVNGSPFSKDMDAEDWRRAKSALDTALDPQGNGAKVAWENPMSGAKGAFTPLAQPYPKDDGICRAFTASVEIQGRGAQALRSSACRRNGEEWIVGRISNVTMTHSGPKAQAPENLAERDIATHLN